MNQDSIMFGADVIVEMAGGNKYEVLRVNIKDNPYLSWEGDLIAHTRFSSHRQFIDPGT